MPVAGATNSMNFLGDLVEHLAKELTSRGIAFDQAQSNTDPVSFLASYIEFERRRISPVPRIVSFSKELEASPERTAFKNAIDNLGQVATKGGDLSPYQTKRLSHFEKRDLLLSDWDIHHLHLGEHKPGQKFAERTGELLYATFSPDTVNFIAVMNHKSFSEIELLEMVESNWPSYLDRFTMRGVSAVSPVPTSADVKELREAGLMTIIQLRSGRVLAPPGGGITTAGTSISCMTEAQRIARILWNGEEYVHAREAKFRQQLGIGNDVKIRLAQYEPAHIAVIGDSHSKALRIPIGR